MEERFDSPIYKKIALDMASRVYKGEFREGQRVHGRSTLAGEYNVSPETIRRAMRLLADMNVIAVSQGSGIHIVSRKNAQNFIERFQSKETIGSLKAEIRNLMGQKRKIESRMDELLGKIIDYSDRLKNVNNITPIEIEIPSNSSIIGKTISESKFWQNTGATIVAIKRNDSVILSPGPYAGFEQGDIIVVVGDSAVLEWVKKFLEGS
jgi:K+/H+ antiporter YhaU regulatory subunit KhtT